MKFTDAIIIYGTVTNDGGKSGKYYRVIDGGTIEFKKGSYPRTISNVFEVADLMMCNTWEEYKPNKELKLPERNQSFISDYYYITTMNDVNKTTDGCSDADDYLYDKFNHFNDEEMAQYIADSQLIYRIVLTLEVLNKGMESCKLHEKIDEYIEENYSDVLDRISEYERKNNL